MDWKRSSGFLAMALRMTCSTSRGMRRLYLVGKGMSSWTCFRAMLMAVSPWKGTTPVIISYMTTPREYISVRSSIWPPLACSGEK